jgi:hypothetical protein
MLHVIKDLQDQLLELIKDDPVRPELALEFRVNDNSKIFVLINDDQQKPMAVTCVKFLNVIPESVEDLAQTVSAANTAVFYTIWSYAKGAGQQLIREVQGSIEREYPDVETYVTLSPKTDIARNFHLKNGAEIYRENLTTVNYLYR